MSIQDSPAEQPVVRSATQVASSVFDVVEEEFSFADTTLTRMYAKHLSAVAVVAVDEEDRVLMINQYRHPVRSRMWEFPAGVLDDAQETMQEAAARELHEEADLTAETWSTLVDFHPSPGMSDEGIRIYLAQGVSEVPEAQRHTREAEEADIVSQWVPLQDAVQAVLAGEVHNGVAVVGILALNALRSGTTSLQPRDVKAPWANHPRGFTV